MFSADSSETSVRLQVCNVVCLLVTTIHQIYAVFYAGDGDPNQPSTLQCVFILVTSSVVGLMNKTKRTNVSVLLMETYASHITCCLVVSGVEYALHNRPY